MTAVVETKNGDVYIADSDAITGKSGDVSWFTHLLGNNENVGPRENNCDDNNCVLLCECDECE